MAICLSIPLLLLLLINFSLSSLANSSAANACEAEQFNKMPCRCCKMSCWYDVAKSVTHELGHVPGQEGEDEALATLRLIRACMIAECTPLCASMGPVKKHRFPSMAEPSVTSSDQKLK